MLRKLLATFLGLGLALSVARAQSPELFYDLNAVQTIALTFTQPNWSYQMDTAKTGKGTYLLAVRCVINGTVFDSVGVKYKGNSSYSSRNAKNPLHIELNHFRKGQKYGTYTDVKLSNVFSDPSFLREVMSYRILGNYMDAPRANIANVSINGANYGVMTNVEDINKRYLTDRFGSSDQVFVKCNPQRAGSVGASDLRYLGSNTALYATSYELKSDTGWPELRNLCDTLNNYPAALPRVLDVDRAIWMLAFNNLLINLDSYSGAFRQNYYLYRDADHRFNPIVWDLNMSFGSFKQLASGTSLDTTGMKNLAPGANATSSLFPLIQKVWNTPQYKRMYIAHLKTMAEDVAGTAWRTEAQQLQTRIAPAVQADNNKFYTYAQFLTNLSASVGGGTGGGPGGGGGNSVMPGLFRLMNGRVAYLNTTTEFRAVAPTLAVPTLSPATPHLNDSVWVRAAVASPTTAPVSSVLLHYRTDHYRMFNQVPMYDDGRHHDGAAGDGVYGAALVARALTTEYYVYAENNNAGIFSPRRAAHDFYTLTATAATLPVAGQVVVNELLADNVAGQTTAAGKYEDWIELYNTTTTPFDLTGLYLTDDPANHQKWAFPSGTVIGAGGYLIVWADEKASTSTELHASFKLSKNGEYVILSTGGRALIDSVGFGPQLTDVAWGRLPNGTGPWRQLPPTFNRANTLPLATATAANAAPGLYPNPADAAVTVEHPAGTADDVVVYNAVGQEVRRLSRHPGATTTLVPTSDLRAGVYYVRTGPSGGRKLLVQH